MSVKSRIKIGGQIFEASSLELPSTGRTFREAYVNNDGIVEVDMRKAKAIHVRKLLDDAEVAAAEAEKAVKFHSAMGDTTAAAKAQAVVNRFRAVPAGAAQDAINGAVTPDALKAVTLDHLLP